MTKVCIAILVTTGLLLAIFLSIINERDYQLQKIIYNLQSAIEETDILLDNNRRILKRIERRIAKQNRLLEQLRKKHENWGITTLEVTAYAPLDPQATQGMCFSGNSAITASGKPVIIGETAAAGRRFPFGTKLYVEGFGWRTITDRGGRITDAHLDVAVETRQEALDWGRQRVRVIYRRGVIQSGR